jgi:hypothetical protein
LLSLLLLQLYLSNSCYFCCFDEVSIPFFGFGQQQVCNLHTGKHRQGTGEDIAPDCLDHALMRLEESGKDFHNHVYEDPSVASGPMSYVGSISTSIIQHQLQLGWKAARYLATFLACYEGFFPPHPTSPISLDENIQNKSINQTMFNEIVESPLMTLKINKTIYL